ncbi:phosphopyruvate hydratase [Candidatus Uhrbacteria bacterium]|nr:phosphopyruvate hydratase [Candidatus Uhrbacteria bacterium]
MHRIKSVSAYEILDSRGNPTVRARVELDNGVSGVASVPSGASTGIHEALELRDNDPKRFNGKGVVKAVRNVNRKIAPLLRGYDVRDQRSIDSAMIGLDGTENKSRLGANSILGVSLACAHAAASSTKKPLYRYLRSHTKLGTKTPYRLPYPTMNILNGGKHADSGLSIQEFMIIPQRPSLRERVRIGAEVFSALKRLLVKKNFSTLVGDEGGFAPRIGTNERALKLIMNAITTAGYLPGKDVLLGLDLAASEFYDSTTGLYSLEHDKKPISSDRMIEIIDDWKTRYPLYIIEDPLDQDDWAGWARITKKLRHKVKLVGDDLFVTNIKRLKAGIDKGVANAILIKLNQIGSVSETLDCISLAQKHSYTVIVSHRSGETGDTTIADLAVATNSDYIKTGSLSRSERVEKYNRLIEIEQEI